MKRAGEVAARGLVALGILASWGALLSFERPLDVVLPLVVVSSAASAAAVVIGLSIWRGTPRSPIILLALASAPPVLLLWRGTAGIRCEAIATESGSVHLAGTLCAPRAASSVPGAVVVHGAGPSTRDEPLFYARYLARRGVAALAYDKRGSGESGGSLYDGGYAAYAADADAMLRVLRRHPATDPTKVGFIGWSEADWVIPLALESGAPAFAIVISGSGLSPEQQVRESIGLRVAAAGYDSRAVEQARAVHDRMHEYLRGAPDSAFRAALEAARGEPWFGAARRNLPDSVWPREDYTWWIDVMDTSTRDAWSAYPGPVLFVKGLLDDRSDGRLLETRVDTLRRGARGSRTDVRLHPRADHGLLIWPFGDRIPPPVWPHGYPSELAAWILEVTRSPPGTPGE